MLTFARHLPTMSDGRRRLDESLGRLRRTIAALGIIVTLVLGSSQIALAQIRPGVTESAAHTANISGTVSTADGKAVAGADIKLLGPTVLSAITDQRGNFSFTSVPWGTYSVAVFSKLGNATKANVSVRGDVTVAIQYPAQSGLKTIAQVSTAGAGIHINTTSSAISSVTPSDFAFDGNTSWAQLLAPVPGVATSGVTIGGVNPVSSIAGAPQVPVILSLNGALPYETSTTLDGMPLQGVSASGSPGAGLDLGSLPLNAFDTADVVRGPGANAPSIVDSIGGSFVLHGPGKVQNTNYELSYSNDPYGGLVSNVKAAFRQGRLSATFIYGINDSPGPLGHAETLGGASYSPTTINGQAVQGSTVFYSQPKPNVYQSGTTLMYCCLEQSTYWSSYGGAAALSYDITPSITAQFFYAGSRSDQSDQYGYWPVQFTPSSASPAYSGSYAASPPGQANYLQMLDATDANPQQVATSLMEEKVTGSIGPGVLRLQALQFNSYDHQSDNGSPTSGMYHLWGTANVGTSSPGTPTAFNGTLESMTFPSQYQTFSQEAHNRDLLGSYALQVGSNSSAGISYSTSYYNNPNAFTLVYEGKPIFSDTQGSDISETTNEWRFHFDTNLLENLSIGASWYIANASFHIPQATNPNLRTDVPFDYSAPRLGIVYQPSHNVAVRASLGGGFALPQLYQLLGFAIQCQPTLCNETATNLNLKPEKSFGFDLGTDVRLSPSTALSFDLYNTNLYGQIFESTSVQTYQGKPLYIQQFGNIATSRMKGINLSVKHDPVKSLYWQGSLGFTRGYVVSVPAGFYDGLGGYPPAPCQKCVNQTVVPGLNFTSSTYSATVPYASGYGQLGYRWKPGDFVDVTATYYGNNNIYQTPNAFVVADAHAGYAFTPNFSLLADFRNFTGAYDYSIQRNYTSYLNPTIQGATGSWSGATYQLPYGPRALIVTGNFKV